MNFGPQTYGGDRMGAELLRLEGPHIPVIVRSPHVGDRRPGGDFLQLDALIDTGASDICIDVKTARRLGLHAVDTTFIGGIGGSVEAVVFAGVLEVPPLHFRRVVRMFSPKDVVLTSKILLGRSFLENFIMTYDGPNGIFHFYNPYIGLGAPVDDE